MNGRMKYNEYIDSLQHMSGPYTKSTIPPISLDLRGMVSFAKSIGKTVPELSDDELSPFVLNATVQDLKQVKISV